MIRRPPRSTLFPTRRSSDLAVDLDRRDHGLLRGHGVRPDRRVPGRVLPGAHPVDRKSTRLNSSHGYISYAVFCLKKKKPGIRRDLRTRPYGPHKGAATLLL